MSDKEKSSDMFCKLTSDTEKEIRTLYKVIDVNWLDPVLVKSKILCDAEYLKYKPKTEEIVHNMLNYYINHKDVDIYKKTDYLCNDREKICICNLHADYFRKIYDAHHYKQENKYISWFKK